MSPEKYYYSPTDEQAEEAEALVDRNNISYDQAYAQLRVPKVLAEKSPEEITADLKEAELIAKSHLAAAARNGGQIKSLEGKGYSDNSPEINAAASSAEFHLQSATEAFKRSLGAKAINMSHSEFQAAFSAFDDQARKQRKRR